MEMEAARFYDKAVARITDVPIRELLNKLADEERKHSATAGDLEEKHLTENARARRRRIASEAILAAGRAARACRTDGRLGFHTGAVICRGLRFP